MLKHSCFLLAYIKYGDNDAILHCFSREEGFQSFFIRGIYHPRNKKKAYLFPLNEIQLTFSGTNRKAIINVSTIEQISSSYSIDVRTSTILMFAADFLHQVLKEQGSDEKVYREIEIFLENLYEGKINSYIVLVYRMLYHQGISPLYSDHLFLNPEFGSFSAVQSHAFFDEKVSAVWKECAVNENLYDIILKRDLRKCFLQSLMIYYKMHFTGFYEPRSLEIIKEIYE